MLFRRLAHKFSSRLFSSQAAPPRKSSGLGRFAFYTLAGCASAFIGFHLIGAENQSKLIMACLRQLDAETSHRLAVRVAGLGPETRTALGLVAQAHFDETLPTRVWNRTFINPIGLAAGFDKNAECIDGMLDMGFGFVEIGSVTPKPQPGNPQPRVFRLLEDQAVINRYGFNSDGHEAVRQRLAQRTSSWGVVGVNLGKNKESPDAVSDYVAGVKSLGPYADYLVVNVSSPNTPGLRALQSKQSLKDLLTAVKQARDQLQMEARSQTIYFPAMPSKEEEQKRSLPPLLLKIAPDLTVADKKDIADVCLEVGIDGLIVSNTTISRPPTLMSENKAQTGGLSGAPLKNLSLQVLQDMYQLTAGRIPLVAAGGIFTAQDAYQRIRNGASLIQLYSALSLEGPYIVSKMRQELAALLKKDGFKSAQEAVGVDNPIKTHK
eukprot:TRINITY_DN1430_c0_g1_i1.p1 TRINITY_DN1430_c0_g1~~TRINITY_DN1430_c0_g1_i1.p1  ORF type:complete len:435 (+),score=145.10 TRINITY_DN1430_c0_g1_i1:70-1374(+)